MESANSQYEIWNLSAQVCDNCEHGEYHKCKCNEKAIVGQLYHALDNLSNDSLDCPTSPKQRHFKTAGLYPHTFTGEYISDDEFEDGFVKEQNLPASSTDWETIDSVLDEEIVGEDKYDSDGDSGLCTSRHSSRLMYTPNNMQMCFVESESDSDKESNVDVEVYYEENHLEEPRCLSNTYENERIASCDSGYAAGDVLDYDIEHVTDIKPRKNSLTPVEASTRILTCLQIHEDHEMHKILERDNSERLTLVHNKNVDDLKHLKEELESRINEVNMQLVDELMMRDELYGYHEALLMDADDLTKSPQEEHFISASPQQNKQTHISEVTLSPRRTKTRFFWKS